jgi:phospholipase C
VSRRILLATAALAAALATVATASHAAPADEPATTRSRRPEHIVVLLQQNHTYDAYFGAYPRGDGGHRKPVSQEQDDGPPIPAKVFGPEDLATKTAPGEESVSNGELAARSAVHDGAMDNFVRAQVRRGFNPTLPMRYWTRDQVPGLWAMADDGVLFDRYFSSAFGGSLVNMLYMISGENHGFVEGTKESLSRLTTADVVTVFDQLREAKRSWKFYVGPIDRIDGDAVVDGTYFQTEKTTPSALYWAPILSMRRFWTDPELRASITDQEAFYEDAAAGTLPDVSFVLPLPTDHPIQAPAVHDRRLTSLVNAIVKGPAWESTTTFVLWDDWGGFYDHVVPPVVDPRRLRDAPPGARRLALRQEGFRVAPAVRPHRRPVVHRGPLRGAEAHVAPRARGPVRRGLRLRPGTEAGDVPPRHAARALGGHEDAEPRAAAPLRRRHPRGRTGRPPRPRIPPPAGLRRAPTVRG